MNCITFSNQEIPNGQIESQSNLVCCCVKNLLYREESLGLFCIVVSDKIKYTQDIYYLKLSKSQVKSSQVAFN